MKDTDATDPNIQRDQIVNIIYDKRRLLFNRRIDTKVKIRTWKEITSEAHKLGSLPKGRDYTFLRDVRWQNWRRRTIFKYKDCKARARKNLPYDASDNMIIEILKEYCPQMLQRQASETNLDDTMKEQLDSSTFSDPFKIECETVEGGEEEQTGFDGSEMDNELPENIPDDDGSDSHQLPTTRSIDEMQQEMMELQNYKLKLELLKMERELYLQPSKYTRSIVESQGYRQDQFE